MYTTSIVLLQDKNHSHIVTSVLDQLGKPWDTAFPLLSDFDALRADIRANRSTAGLRRQLGDFISRNGYPFLVVMDLRADLGLPPAQDPERNTLLRAVLLSFALLSSHGPHKGRSLHLVCLAETAEAASLQHVPMDPRTLLEPLRSADERIMAILKPYLDNADLARRTFHIHVLPYPQGGDLHNTIRKLQQVICGVDRMIQDGHHTLPTASSGPLNPASAVFRATPERLVIDGRIREATPEERRRLVESVLYLLGGLTEPLLPRVFQNIASTLAAIPKVRPLRKDAPLVLYIPDDSVVDDAFPLRFGPYLSNTLGRQYRIALRIEKTNLERLSRTPGFIALRDLVNRPA